MARRDANGSITSSDERGGHRVLTEYGAHTSCGREPISPLARKRRTSGQSHGRQLVALSPFQKLGGCITVTIGLPRSRCTARSQLQPAAPPVPLTLLCCRELLSISAALRASSRAYGEDRHAGCGLRNGVLCPQIDLSIQHSPVRLRIQEIGLRRSFPSRPRLASRSGVSSLGPCQRLRAPSRSVTQSNRAAALPAVTDRSHGVFDQLATH